MQLSLDTPIRIFDQEMTPDQWMNENAKKEHVDHYFVLIVCDGAEAALNYWLELFHDHIRNKNITYEIL